MDQIRGYVWRIGNIRPMEHGETRRIALHYVQSFYIMIRVIVILGLIALVVAGARAQDRPDRLMLEAGLVGGNSIACPGHYVGITGRIAGRASLYGMVENFRCADLVGNANRLGLAFRIGPSKWLVRPSLRGGIEYDGGELSQHFAAGLTLGRRRGARFIIHVGEISNGTALILFQMGGYLSFGS
ncbi:MAG: hypothetical protein OXD43_15965 [Bacteroidetes bacterium]|nr:hypothetical protein [Bacteroidota bacterium]